MGMALFDVPVTIENIRKARGGRGNGHQLPNEGGTNVWLTPPGLLNAPGPFDLDPCAAPEPRPWPTAARHYTPPQDGLQLPWEGRVWLNPPYGPYAADWLRRLVQHGDGIALIFARVETDYFHNWVWDRADALLFLRGRLHFYRPTGEKGGTGAGAPSVLIAYGSRNVEALRNSDLLGRFLDLRRNADA